MLLFCLLLCLDSNIQSQDFSIPGSSLLSALSYFSPLLLSSPPSSIHPLPCPLLFSFSSLMFLVNSQHQTNFLSLSLSPWHTCALCFFLPPPFLPVKHPSTSVSQSPPLTSLASLWSHQSPSQSSCHSSQLLSSQRETGEERNVFRPCRSAVISPPVWNDSLVTHSFIGNSL